MNIGVFGGTFDPVHKGHLAMVEEVRNRLNLAEVLFIPAGQPWLKISRPISVAQHRVQMVRLAIAGKPYCKLSTIEIERPGPTYTIDTIVQLQTKLGAEAELYFILGWDSFYELPQWKESSRLVKMCHLVAVPRTGYPSPELNSLEAAVPGLKGSAVILNLPEIDISASEIRNRVARGLPIDHLVPEPVDKYIREHGLYLTQ